MWFLVHSDFFGLRYQNHFDSAGQRDRSRWERELHFFFVLSLIIIIIIIIIKIIIIILDFSLTRSAFCRCVSANLLLEVSALRQWLPIRAHKSFHRCVLCSNFRLPFSTSLFFFAFWLLPFLSYFERIAHMLVV